MTFNISKRILVPNRQSNMRRAALVLKTLLLLLTTLSGVLPQSLCAAALSNTLDIYFIDTEGGAATLIVTPAGESLLVDAGNPGARDARRIAHVALEVAKLERIDFCIITHYHADHFGGVSELLKLIPIKRFYDHGAAPNPLPKDINPQLWQAYRQATRGKATTLRPRDRISFKRQRATPAVILRVVASDGIVTGEEQKKKKKNAAQTQAACEANFQPLPLDATDNRRSVAFVLTFGKFKFFDGGDLTWNTEHRLVCPKNLVGTVDVYQVNHHGMDASNNPAFIAALNPRVAVINNGARKGGQARTFATLKNISSIQDIYQAHRNVLTTSDNNTASALIANEEESECPGNFIKLTVNSKRRTYTVNIPGKNTARTYLLN